jgi:hypothetical protein
MQGAGLVHQSGSTPVDLHPTVLGRLRLALRNTPISLRPPEPCALARPGLSSQYSKQSGGQAANLSNPSALSFTACHAPKLHPRRHPLPSSIRRSPNPPTLQCPKSPDRPLRPIAWPDNRLPHRGPWCCPCAVTPILLSHSHPRHSPPSVHPFRLCCLSRQLPLHFARPTPPATPITENLLGLLPPPSSPFPTSPPPSSSRPAWRFTSFPSSRRP